jgi:hypothetical protein
MHLRQLNGDTLLRLFFSLKGLVMIGWLQSSWMTCKKATIFRNTHLLIITADHVVGEWAWWGEQVHAVLMIDAAAAGFFSC